MIEKVSTFKQRLNEAMSLRNIRAVDLSKKTHISESTISQYRSGYAEPKEDKLAKIADALQANPAWLMGLNVVMDLKEHQFIEKNYNYELNASRLAAYNMRDYWAWHILEVGDNLPKAGVEEIINFADYLASKYKVTNLTSEEQLNTIGIPSSMLD